MSRIAEVASFCDHVFEAAQRALDIGNMDKFKVLAEQHRGLAELFNHLRAGGMVH